MGANSFVFRAHVLLPVQKRRVLKLDIFHENDISSGIYTMIYSQVSIIDTNLIGTVSIIDTVYQAHLLMVHFIN